MNTFRYKGGYIHDNFTTGVVLVQIDPYAYPVQVKSVLAAKQLITKYLNNAAN